MRASRAIAAAQTIPVRGEVGANVEQHLRLVEAAASEKARVLVFPELSLTGYEIDLARDLAFSPEDPRLAPLLDAAASSNMTLIAGAPVRMPPWLYIAAFILAPDRTVAIYTKQRLGAFPASASADGAVPPAEETVFRPGTLDPLVTFDGHTAAVAVCADTGRLSHPRDAAERGAKTYLASMFLIPSDFKKESTGLGATAKRYSMATAMANYGGPSGGLTAAGGTAIWSQRGEILAQLGTSGAGLAVAIEGRDGWQAKTLTLGVPSIPA
jgi:predicted amidohydrolase